MFNVLELIHAFSLPLWNMYQTAELARKWLNANINFCLTLATVKVIKYVVVAYNMTLCPSGFSLFVVFSVADQSVNGEMITILRISYISRMWNLDNNSPICHMKMAALRIWSIVFILLPTKSSPIIQPQQARSAKAMITLTVCLPKSSNVCS